jgi:hypothetical protein
MKMSTYWKIEANGGWTYDDSDLADDVAGYLAKVLSGCISYVISHHDVAPDPPRELYYGSYAYRSEQVFALYNHTSNITLEQLCGIIKQRVECVGEHIFRDEYKFFRFLPLTREEFNRQTEYFKDAKYDEVLADDDVLSNDEVQPVQDNVGAQI